MPERSIDIALFGKDDTERIVAVDAIRDDARGARVRVYRRTADDRVEREEAPLYPFFFLAQIEPLAGFAPERFQYVELAGDNPYRLLVACRTWRDYRDALRHVERATGTETRRSDAVYTVGGPVQQYLMQSGRTLFAGMTFDALHRLQLDIEVRSSGGFPRAQRAEDEVIIVALSDNRGWSHLAHAREQTEAELLREVIRIVRERDPDVIEGHNIYGFDLPYLEARCARYGIPFALGRDGAAPRSFPSSMRFAERTIEFPAYEIAGRHVIDTYLLAMGYDVFKRDLPGYGLKAVARYFGFAPPDRTYVPGDQITRVWDEDPDRLLDYALDDVVETRRLAEHLSGSTFYLTQMLPTPYGQVARTGPASKIEALFVREYLRRRHSLPRAGWGTQAVGGYTDVFITGVVGPVVYADVESLYPSIMLGYDVRPASDTLGLFPDLLRHLTALRLETKAAMRTAPDDDARGELDARQSSLKVLINAFYGSLGFSLALFNDVEEADRVARIGQQILRQLIAAIRRAGGRVIEVDTDGVLFIPPPDVEGEAAERAFVDRLTAAMPEGIRVGFDGRFARMLSYKKKNYALLGYDGSLKFKGSSLVSRSVERFGRRFVRDCIRLLLDEDVQGLHDRYLAERDRILAHDWPDAGAFARTETLKDTLEQYTADVEAGRRTRTAAYELARERARATGRAPRKGDRIAYYVAGTGANVTAFEHARLADAWRRDAPDENTAYYLKRLDEFARKFEPFFTTHDFRLIFSAEDLFGFTPDGIRILTHERQPTEVEDDVPF